MSAIWSLERFMYEMFRYAVKDLSSYRATDTHAKPYPSPVCACEQFSLITRGFDGKAVTGQH